MSDSTLQLIKAALDGDYVTVEQSLKQPDVDINGHSKTLTPLTAAANSGNVQIIQLLLKQNGINVNLRSPLGLTALHLAVLRGHLEAVRILSPVVSGCLRNAQKQNAYQIAALRERNANLAQEKALFTEIQRVLAPDLLIDACMRGELATVKYLIDEVKLNVNTQTSDGDCALTAACGRAMADVVDYLLSCPGISVNIQDNVETPLYAALSKHPGEENWLHLQGKNINFVRYKIAEKLIKHGADVNARMNTIGRPNPLFAAVFREDLPMVRLLVENKADLTVQFQALDEKPRNIIEIARGHGEHIHQYLLKAANPNNGGATDKATPWSNAVVSHGAKRQRFHRIHRKNRPESLSHQPPPIGSPKG